MKSAWIGGAGWLVAASLTTGCFAPVMHPVEIAEFGHVTASVAAQTTGGSLQGEAQAAVGVVPHLQLEGSTALGLDDSWSAGAGLRGQIPVVPKLLSVQVAGLYDHQSLTPVGSLFGCGSFFDGSGGCAQSYGAMIDAWSAEVGLVGRFLRTPGSASWGLWIAQGWGSAETASTAALSLTTVRASLEIPFDDARRWNLLIGLTARQSSLQEANGYDRSPADLGLGTGLVARF